MSMTADLPDYACAIISAPDGCRLLQLRPASARHAAGQLTCFGGRREPQESAETCLLRELDEELKWTATTLLPACELRQGRHFIARFFHCPMPRSTRLATEPGHIALWIPPLALSGLPLSPWHRMVLLAVDRGVGVVELPADLLP
jgi:8-oxo-dGTP pyrophosphatase MutT (NUDIX family)